jgi:DNA-binding transcriptional regulator YhcF (GntR family)
MPALPSRHANEPIDFEPTSPYQQLAFELRDRIRGGVLVADLPIPPVKQLAVEHGVSVATAQRAVRLLRDWGYVEVNSGRRTLVRRLSPADAAAEQVGRSGSRARAELVDLEIRRLGETVTRLSTVVDPADAGALRKLLGDAVRRDGRGASALGDYEMVVRYSGERGVVATFVATS